jgi:hypothetical protein
MFGLDASRQSVWRLMMKSPLPIGPEIGFDLRMDDRARLPELLDRKLVKASARGKRRESSVDLCHGKRIGSRRSEDTRTYERQAVGFQSVEAS